MTEKATHSSVYPDDDVTKASADDSLVEVSAFGNDSYGKYQNNEHQNSEHQLDNDDAMGSDGKGAGGVEILDTATVSSQTAAPVLRPRATHPHEAPEPSITPATASAVDATVDETTIEDGQDTPADDRRGNETAGDEAGVGRGIRTEALETGDLDQLVASLEDLSDPRLYLNRESTWLSFNARVLNEARDFLNPILERVKFLSIVGSNIDEFFMKRIGGLKLQEEAGLRKLTVDGRSPSEQITEAYSSVKNIENEIEHLIPELIGELSDAGVEIIDYEDLSSDDRIWMRQHYLRNIFPLVTPQALDPAHPFPFVSNLSLNLLVSVRELGSPDLRIARVKVPSGRGLPRFVAVRDSQRFVHLANIMENNLDLLFPSMEVVECERFHVTRNANIERNEESAEDLMDAIESEIRDRKLAPIVRLVVARSMSALSRSMLAKEFELDAVTDIFDTSSIIPTSDLMEIYKISRPDLKFHPHVPVDCVRLDRSRSIFGQVRELGNVLLHHPYESFVTSVERFLQESSVDPDVLAIKMTLYRTSRQSKVIEYLIDAAQNGKQVAVVVELKARFDEEANMRWASRLEESGIHVTYGIVGLKTHCKTILVIRNEKDGLQRYFHIGTGNYHAVTARQYSDLGILGCDDDIGNDLTELFNYLTTGFAQGRHYRSLLVAPSMIKQTLIEKIRGEARQAGRGETARICFKLNALEDPDITRELYEASRMGVTVDLIIRDTCRLRPGIAGLSENIRVTSIVGRFLEHTRVYNFFNGGVEEFYIGSADAMTRNLEHRVEVLVPVHHQPSRDVLSEFLAAQLADTRSAWDMHADGSYLKRNGPLKASGVQDFLIESYEKAANHRKLHQYV